MRHNPIRRAVTLTVATATLATALVGAGTVADIHRTRDLVTVEASSGYGPVYACDWIDKDGWHWSYPRKCGTQTRMTMHGRTWRRYQASVTADRAYWAWGTCRSTSGRTRKATVRSGPITIWTGSGSGIQAWSTSVTCPPLWTLHKVTISGPKR